MERLTMPNRLNASISTSNGKDPEFYAFCDWHPEFQLNKTPAGLFCLRCAREKRDDEDREYGRLAVFQDRKRATYGVLERHSIIADETIKVATLDSFKTMHPKQAEVHSEIRRIMNDFVKGERKNIWLVGDSGAGKSHSAMAILKGINEYGLKSLETAFENGDDIQKQGYSCVFMTINEMYRDIKRSFREKFLNGLNLISWICAGM